MESALTDAPSRKAPSRKAGRECNTRCVMHTLAARPLRGSTASFAPVRCISTSGRQRIRSFVCPVCGCANMGGLRLPRPVPPLACVCLPDCRS